MVAKITTLDADDIVERYQAGIGIRGIADILGVSPAPITRILKERGIHLRNRAEQQQARMDRTPAAERKRLASAAHEAVRGRKKSKNELIQAAKTREINQTGISFLEFQFAYMLRANGIYPIHQKAIGPYNCDLAIHPVAVEIFGGGWHWHGDHLARTEERFRYILNAGWHILVFAIDQRRWPLTPDVADYAVGRIQHLRRTPTLPREYRVIWGAGEFEIVGHADDDHLTIEPPFTNARDPATGQYKRIAR